MRDRAYLSWIRSLPCCVCGSLFRIEAHHTGLRGFGQIADDRSAIPLCFRHHDRREPYSIHKLGLTAFCERFDINIPALVARLSEKPRLFIEDALYVVLMDGKSYHLDLVRCGVAASIILLRDMRRETFADDFQARTRPRRPVA